MKRDFEKLKRFKKRIGRHKAWFLCLDPYQQFGIMISFNHLKKNNEKLKLKHYLGDLRKLRRYQVSQDKIRLKQLEIALSD